MSIKLWVSVRALLAVTVGALLAVVPLAPASAAGVGYIRLAHLVPDGIKCDMYIQLDRVDGDVVKKLPSITYGTLSAYEPVPAGTYAVTMRKPGTPVEQKPVLATTITVEEGKAYTAARMGEPDNAEARVFADDRTLPPGGTVRVRVVQAAQRVVDVQVADGPKVGTGITFTEVTPYVDVRPGKHTITVSPAGGTPVTVTGDLAAGTVYSVLVLQDTDGVLTARVRADASRTGQVPSGGVATGAGGTATPTGFARLVGVSGLAVVAVAVLLVTARRLRRTP